MRSACLLVCRGGDTRPMSGSERGCWLPQVFVGGTLCRSVGPAAVDASRPEHVCLFVQHAYACIVKMGSGLREQGRAMGLQGSQRALRPVYLRPFLPPLASVAPLPMSTTPPTFWVPRKYPYIVIFLVVIAPLEAGD